MIKPKILSAGDKVAIVSLSSGILGDKECQHQLELGVNRLKTFGLVPVFMPNALKGSEYLHNHPEARAQDLKDAFFDETIKAIICAIGGDDTYRILPYLLEDIAFIEKVQSSPKIFTGFSDTTNNHLMFHKLGIVSYYGINFLSDLAELGPDLLPYTQNSFMAFFENLQQRPIESSPIWYDERTDFSLQALGTSRIERLENRGYEVLMGKGKIHGKLLGGCLESLYDGYTGDRYPEQKTIYEKYQLMPSLDEWKGKILFIETSEERPTPDLYRIYINELNQRGIFRVIKGIIVGKPQNERYYNEYRAILKKVSIEHSLPILFNVNFGHSYPRTIIPYGVDVLIDFDFKTILVTEPMFG